MKKIFIDDMTLCKESGTLSFKEKIEIARQLENLNTDVIELPEIENIRTDTLLIRTISSFVKKSILSVSVGMNSDGVANAANALTGTAKPRLKVALPVSAVQMEYVSHKKAPKMLELINQLVSESKEKCNDVEFCAVDATRAEEQFLIEAINTAIEAGATTITVCDNEAVMMPDEFGSFISRLISKVPELNQKNLGVMCENNNGMAAASAMLAVKNGAATVKTAACGDIASLETIVGILKNCGNNCGFTSNIKYTELNRIVKQITWISNSTQNGKITVTGNDEGDGIKLCANDDISVIISAVKKLGYDLSEEDYSKVYEEFKRVAEKKTVAARELDAIVASVALQVPPTYKLSSYVINTGNIISASAQIKLEKAGEEMTGISIGDGPIDASFRTVELIIGHHFELDDFQIQSVTEGKEAMGSALVRLRSNGKLYSGNGISTDIIGASIRAYLNALNKIVYEEA